MYTDMVGYTALGQRNESLSLALVEEQKRLVRPITKRHNGKLVKMMGDSLLVELPSALEGVRCAYEIQRAAREFNVPLPDDKRMHLRVGLHLGDVIESEGDISGDAVNIASRVEPFAQDGGVCLTGQVYDQVQNKFELRLVSLGVKALKNVSAPIEVFRMVMPWEEQKDSGSTWLSRKRIAVLPFVNISPNPEDEYFADGVTEEVISTVSRIGNLSVTSRTSSMHYKNSSAKVADIGRDLNVGSILEGSIRKAGNRVRITTQLVDVDSDRQIWTDTYDRQMEDLFAIQSDIAWKVADALRVQLREGEKQRIESVATSNPEAYVSYLKGRFYWNERTEQGLKRAVEYFQHALSLDPRFALAYVGLADCYHILMIHGYLETKPAITKAMEYAIKALEIDQEIAEAHATLAFVLSNSLKFGKAEHEFRTAIRLNPNYAHAHHWYSEHKSYLGEFAEALAEIERARELDPYSLQVNVYSSLVYYAVGEYDTSIKRARAILEMEPRAVEARGWMALSYAEKGMFSDAIREAKTAYESGHPYGPGWLGYVYAKAKMKGEALRIIDTAKQVTQQQKKHLDPGVVAIIYSGLDMKDEAFEWLEQATRQGSMALPFLRSYPWFANLRMDERYSRLLEELGLTRIQIGTTG